MASPENLGSSDVSLCDRFSLYHLSQHPSNSASIVSRQFCTISSLGCLSCDYYYTLTLHMDSEVLSNWLRVTQLASTKDQT